MNNKIADIAGVVAPRALVESDKAVGIIKELSEEILSLEKEDSLNIERINSLKAKIVVIKEALQKANEEQNQDKNQKGGSSLNSDSDKKISSTELRDFSKNFSDFLDSRQSLSVTIKRGLQDGSIKSLDTEDPNAKILSCKNINEILPQVLEVYKHLEESGLDVRKAEINKDKKLTSFFAIRFPEEYRGNRDPMLISKEEIIEVLECQKRETPQQKKSNDSKNFWWEALGDDGVVRDRSIVTRSLGIEDKIKVTQNQSVESDVLNTSDNGNNYWAKKVRSGELLGNKGAINRVI